MQDVIHREIYFEHTWQSNPFSFLIWRMDLIKTFMGDGQPDKQTDRQAGRRRHTDTQTHSSKTSKTSKISDGIDGIDGDGLRMG